MHIFYQKKHNIYLELYEQTRGQFKKLSALFEEE